MIATKEYVQKQLDKYNALIFGGKLPSVEICLSNAERFIGKMEYRAVRGVFGKVRGYDNFRMRISTHRDLPQNELDDVIIHEMIHCYIASSGIKDTSAHGQVFRSMMTDINSRFGRNITISHRDSNPVESIARRSVPHFICISKMPGGELGVTVCARTKVFDIMRQIPRYYKVQEMKWYFSADPFFSQFRRSNTPKIYRADQNLLTKALENSTELVFDGRVLGPKK